MMTAYLSYGAKDFEKSRIFYDAAFATIGWSSHMEFPGWRAWSAQGKGEGFSFWICAPYNGEAATAGNGTMLGLMAGSQAEVDAFYAAAMANGGSDEGAPGYREDYGPDWYAAYVRDPSGNKLGIVHKK